MFLALSLTPVRLLLPAPPPCLANRHVHPQDQEAVQRLADAAQLGQAQLGAPRRALDHDQEHQRAARARGPAGAYVGGARGTTGGLEAGSVGGGGGVTARHCQGGPRGGGGVQVGVVLLVRRVRSAMGWDAPRRADVAARDVWALGLTLVGRALSLPPCGCGAPLPRSFPPVCVLPPTPLLPPRRRQTWPTSPCGWHKSRKSTRRRRGTPTACGWCGSTCRWASSASSSSPRSCGWSARGGEGRLA